MIPSSVEALGGLLFLAYGIFKKWNHVTLKANLCEERGKRDFMRLLQRNGESSILERLTALWLEVIDMMDKYQQIESINSFSLQ